MKRQENQKAKGTIKNNPVFKKPEDVRAETVDKLFSDKTFLLNKKSRNLTDTKRKTSILGHSDKKNIPSQNLNNTTIGITETSSIFTPENKPPSQICDVSQKSKIETENMSNTTPFVPVSSGSAK